MTKGVGIDIVEISRLKQAIDKWGDDFLNRVFTKKEIEYSMQKRFPFQHLAARFAAKESIIKAFGNNPVTFKDIEIINDKFGKPSCRIHKKRNHIHLSIAHTDKYAIATAVI
ncbi:MAG: holo-ACP synthase [Candidatus Omnitrophica bacterium]|nr:holo-ACP synthase [Candidatus Omnitrophota bacterium]